MLARDVSRAVLRHLGNVIRANLRDTDFAARLGGDEFALLLADSEGGAAMAVAAAVFFFPMAYSSTCLTGV